MVTKKLGKTGLFVGAIGQGSAYPQNKMRQNASEIIYALSCGIDCGMNLIDTAEIYGDGRAEELIGEVIKHRRSEVVIATKFLPEHADYNGVLQAVENSLKRLETDYIDLYQFHWSNPRIPIAETVSAIEKCIREGKVRFIGASNFSRRELDELRIICGSVRLVSLQVEYNILERSIENSGLLDYCGDHLISILAYSPLDQGRFFGMNASKKFVLAKLAKEYNRTIPQIILNWLISHEPVIAIPMATNYEHVVDNFRSAEFNLRPEDIRLIDRVFDAPIVKVPIGKIRVSVQGERGHKVYESLEEAIQNPLNFIPSPADLAKAIKLDSEIKPVRLIEHDREIDGYSYDLINGRIRFWAWVIAHGFESSIPAYVRENKGGV